jgi:predicted esterase
LLVHGRNDSTVPFALAEQTCVAASTVGVLCELVAHDAGHGVPPDTFDDVSDFIGRVLGDIEADEE